MTWYIFIFLFFSFLGVILGLSFFFKKKGDRAANILLGTYTILFAYELIYYCLQWGGYLNQPSHVHLNETHRPIWLIYGPLVYFYVRRVVKKVSFKWSDILLLVPSLLTILLVYPFYQMSTDEKVGLLAQGKPYSIYEKTFLPYNSIWVVLLIMLVYAYCAYFNFKDSKKVGYREKTWLAWFVGSYAGFVLAFAFFVALFRNGVIAPRFNYLIDIVILFFIGGLAFFGFFQPDIFNGKSLKEILPFVKYRKAGLSDALSLAMKEKLLRIMEEHEPYLDNKLRLDDLALHLNLSRNHTSQIINEHFNLSFFDFVNKYRIAYAKNLLLQNKGDGRTITQLAFDVGFNNRASFYRAFKKFTNVTPTEYLRHMEVS
ncbi:helix-turn-helix domain-containing protein [Maribacter halichondriae]|uniref:helix-turn-helix domain-containing protein n=1 Tax=Maribacter halichondriae TaxID=2980554 RepID=UPI0023582595|nr:AraC family transcriptional regulator [Maribacter sp. Hal144]